MLPTRHPGREWKIAALVLVAIVLAACGGAQARKAKHLEKGHTYLVAGNFDKARVEFRNALQIAPADAEARFENGVVDEKMGNVREAAQFYQGAIDVEPSHLQARIRLAKLYLFSALPDKALELIDPAFDKNPDNPELLTIRAAVRVQKNDVSGALADAERAVQLNPNVEDAVGALAGIYSANKQPDKAKALLESAVKRIPNTVDLRLALAQVYAGLNQQAETEQVLLDLVRVAPTQRAHRVRLAQFYARVNQLDAAEKSLRDGVTALPADKDMKFALIDFLAARRSREMAESELKAMVAADASDTAMKIALGKFYESSRMPDKAETVYREIIATEKLEPAGLAARDRLAGSLVQRNDVAGAETLLNEVLAKSPRDSDALLLRGNIALGKKDPKAAIADLRAVLRDQPNAVPVLRTLARAHMANGEPAIAEETMRRALEANPKDAALRLDLAQLLAQLGKPDQAKPIVAGLVKDEPANALALDTLFRVSAAVKDFDSAKLAADGIVSSEPKSAKGYLYQGMLAQESKHTDEALRLFRLASDLQPDLLEPVKAQIQLLVNTRRFDDAIKRLDEVSARLPGDPLAPNLKGQVYLAQGRLGDAQVAFKQAIAMAPTWWEPYRGVALTQFAQKDLPSAIATLRQGADGVDEPERLVTELATLLERGGKVDEAIDEYEKVLKRSPNSDVAVNNLAMLLITYRSDPPSLDRAKTLASRFAESSNPAFLDTYGWVLFKRGEANASVPVLERVLAKAPDSPVALYHLGMAQSKAGSNLQARDNLSRAVKSGTKFSGMEEAKATLERLSSTVQTVSPKS